jgi:GNAT superfamily N-acetyltransferase
LFELPDLITGEQPMTLRVVTLAERPDLESALEPLNETGWPRFTLASAAGQAYSDRLMHEFADYQVLLVDGDRLVGAGHSAPFSWDGSRTGLPSGWDEVFAQAMADRDAGRMPTASAALGITLAGEARGKGLSHLLLRGLRQVAADHGLGDLVAPVRPSLKAAYPLQSMERYLDWTAPDGRRFDPWLRVHVGLGGAILGICPASMVITGTVAEWEAWTGMRFPDSGAYVVPGALVPVEIDREGDQGRYVEPNVWVHHRLTTAR